MSARLSLGIAAVLTIAGSLSTRANDASPRELPNQMDCKDFVKAFDPKGLTKIGFSIDAIRSLDQQKSGDQWCVRVPKAKLQDYKVKSTITSTYHKWVVTDKEKSCRSEADKANAAMKRFEQEHIDDSDPILVSANKKLDAVKDKQFCAANPSEAANLLQNAVNDIIDEAQASWNAKRDQRDSGSHTYNYNCSCAP